MASLGMSVRQLLPITEGVCRWTLDNIIAAIRSFFQVYSFRKKDPGNTGGSIMSWEEVDGTRVLELAQACFAAGRDALRTLGRGGGVVQLDFVTEDAGLKGTHRVDRIVQQAVQLVVILSSTAKVLSIFITIPYHPFRFGWIRGENMSACSRTCPLLQLKGISQLLPVEQP